MAFEAAFCEPGEAYCIGSGSLGFLYDAFVAGHFAFEAKSLFQPQQDGVDGEENQPELLG